MVSHRFPLCLPASYLLCAFVTVSIILASGELSLGYIKYHKNMNDLPDHSSTSTQKTANEPSSNLRIAIVHDWLYRGGGEKVVLELHRMFPDAPIYTSYCTPEWRAKLNHQVITGYLNRWPFTSLRKFLAVLRQHWFRRLDLSSYDLVISSSGNGEARFVLPNKPRGAKPIHVSYTHSPTHYYWAKYDEYLANPGFKPAWLARLGLKTLVRPLRCADYRSAQSVDFFVANSTSIQADIKKYYDRDSTVIFPPVDTSRISAHAKTHAPQQREGFVTLCRQTVYKRVDVVVQACTQASLPLVVMGDGPEHDNLRAIAGPAVTFLRSPSDEEVATQLARAQAFLYAAHEDFGIVQVEALAAGTPVIAYRAGGSLDQVIEGKTGLFFDEQTPASLLTAIERFQPDTFDANSIQSHAASFSNALFQRRMRDYLARLPKLDGSEPTSR
jgi:glycosyltransferase involved in cell wall biosynthesis